MRVSQEVGRHPQRGCPAMPFLNRLRDTVVRDQERTMLQAELRQDGRSGRDVSRKQNATAEEGTETERAATSWKLEDNRKDLQEGSRAGDREAKSWVFSQDSENECQNIVEWSAPSETKEETTNNRVKRQGCRNVVHCRNCCPHRSVKENDGDEPGPTGILCGNHLGRAA
jgi:hypothetical protein